MPYWKLAKDFLEAEHGIIVSTIVLKELSFQVADKFDYVMKFFKHSDSIRIIKTTNDDYELARKYENEEQFVISFYDYLHVAIAKRLKIPLITRDKELL